MTSRGQFLCFLVRGSKEECEEMTWDSGHGETKSDDHEGGAAPIACCCCWSVSKKGRGKSQLFPERSAPPTPRRRCAGKETESQGPRREGLTSSPLSTVLRLPSRHGRGRIATGGRSSGALTLRTTGTGSSVRRLLRRSELVEREQECVRLLSVSSILLSLEREASLDPRIRDREEVLSVLRHRLRRSCPCPNCT